MSAAHSTADAGRTALLAIVEHALAFQDSREPKYRAPETETAAMLTPNGFPTYQHLRVIADLVKALEFYADEKNWKAGSVFVMESGNFDGWSMARAALSSSRSDQQ